MSIKMADAKVNKQVVVIAGPTGSGKNSIIDAIRDRCSNCERLVTATTRTPRDGERDGIDYHFLTKEEFDAALERGDILEHRYVPALDTHYGVYRPDLEQRLAKGEVVLAHVDIIGARYLKKHYNATTFFIQPASFGELERRVRTRAENISDKEVEARLAVAREEIGQHAPEYDYHVSNPDGKLEDAVAVILEILEKEGYTLGT